MGIHLYNHTLNKIEIDKHIHTTGTILKRINHIGTTDLVILFDLNKPDTKMLSQYIKLRELDIIQEFKNLIK